MGPNVAYYEDAPDGGIIRHATLPVTDDVTASGDFAFVDLPGIEQAADHRPPRFHGRCHADRAGIGAVVEAHGYKSTGHSRELYLNYGTGDPDMWRTELQEPVEG